MVGNQGRRRARIDRHVSRFAGLALIAVTSFACATSDRHAPEKREEKGVVDGSLAKPDEARVTTGSEPGQTPRKSACEAMPPPPGALVPEGARDAAAADRALKEGLAKASEGDYGAALEAYERALAADPFLGLAYLEAAEAHLYTDDDREKMRTLLATAVTLLPQNPRVHLRYADVMSQLGDPKRAEAHWRCALELRPDLLDARRHLAAHLFTTGRLDDAKLELSDAAAAFPEDIQVHVMLGDVLEAKKEWLAAAQAIDAAAKLAKKSAALYRRAASLYERAGNVVAAKKANAEADRIDPPAKDRNLRPLPKARGGE